MILKNNPSMQFNIEPINKDNEKEWVEVMNMGTTFFSGYFYDMLSRIDYAVMSSYKEIDLFENVLFAKLNGEICGCAIICNNRYLFPYVEDRKNTLFLEFLMVKTQHQGKGAGSQLLNAVIDFAKQNDYKYISLLSSKSTKDTKSNLYEKNDFKKVAKYLSQQGLYSNFVFRMDVSKDITDFSKLIFDTYSNLFKLKDTAISQRQIMEELSARYVDLIKTQKKLTFQDIEKIKNDELLVGASIGIKDMLSKKYNANEVSEFFHAKKMLKSVNVVKPAKLKGNDVSAISIETMETLSRVFKSVDDECTNNKINLSMAKK